MYCCQCGKKVMDNMLFCPFCGSPIIIPDQDEPAAVQPVMEAQLPEPEPPVELPPEEIVPQEDFVPLSFDRYDARPAEMEVPPAAEPESFRFSFDDFVADSEPEPQQPPVQPEEKLSKQELMDSLRFSFDELERKLNADPEPAQTPPEPEKPEPVPEKPAVTLEKNPDDAAQPKRPPKRTPEKPAQADRKRNGKTYIPFKDVDPDDLFMDEPDDDEYDLPDDDDFDDDFDFEEPEEGGFFQRHIRGIVGLILLLIVVAILIVWAMLPQGQKTLARINLAWDAEVYADLGYEAYHQDSDLLAAKYYEKALAREPENYDYAHSAMVAYYEADQIESAASMLKKCVEMRPDDAEPYQEMLILYPDPATRPWEITELVKMGYQRTGDASLRLE